MGRWLARWLVVVAVDQSASGASTLLLDVVSCVVFVG